MRRRTQISARGADKLSSCILRTPDSSQNGRSVNKIMLAKNIIKTLAYYQALGNMPLTLVEIQKYLISKKGGSNIPLFDIQKILEKMTKDGVIEERNGFFMLTPPKTASPHPMPVRYETNSVPLSLMELKNEKNKNFYKKRIENIKNTHKKWKKFSKISKFIIYIPYVRSVSVTGSVALNNASAKSDLDIFIETQRGRIWTTRLFITTISWIFGRKRHSKKINNRLCFNRYVCEDSNLGPRHINYVVKNRISVWKQKKNTKNETIYFFKPNYIVLLVKAIVEFILNITGLGMLGEKISGWAQVRKIKNNSTQ